MVTTQSDESGKNPDIFLSNTMCECLECDYVYWDSEWKRRCEYLDDEGVCPFGEE